MAELFDSLAGLISFTHHFCVFIFILQRPEELVTSCPADFWGHVKFDHRLNRSRDIAPEVIFGCIFDGFCAITVDRK